jgi:hypothetical protein
MTARIEPRPCPGRGSLCRSTRRASNPPFFSEEKKQKTFVCGADICATPKQNTEP